MFRKALISNCIGNHEVKIWSSAFKHYVVGPLNPLKTVDYLSFAVEMEILLYINELSLIIQYHG